MGLSPDQVAAKRFKTVRIRPGYDIAEVDDFLDEIELRWREDRKRIVELERQIGQLQQR